MKFLTLLLYSLGALALFWAWILARYHLEGRARTRRIEREIRASRRRTAELQAKQYPSREDREAEMWCKQGSRRKCRPLSTDGEGEETLVARAMGSTPLSEVWVRVPASASPSHRDDLPPSRAPSFETPSLQGEPAFIRRR